jgi:hypothetical protein
VLRLVQVLFLVWRAAFVDNTVHIQSSLWFCTAAEIRPAWAFASQYKHVPIDRMALVLPALPVLPMT